MCLFCTRRSVFQYSVNVEKKSLKVCQKFFLSVHGIQKLRKKLLDQDVKYLRGKHTNRPRRTKVGNINKVHEYLIHLPAIESHYSRTKNKHKRCLSSELSVAKLNRKYNEQFPDNTVSYAIFYKIFNDDFNYSFSHPKKDICTTCTKLLADINAAKLYNNDNSLKQLTILHKEPSKMSIDTVSLVDLGKLNSQFVNTNKNSFIDKFPEVLKLVASDVAPKSFKTNLKDIDLDYVGFDSATTKGIS